MVRIRLRGLGSGQTRLKMKDHCMLEYSVVRLRLGSSTVSLLVVMMVRARGLGVPLSRVGGEGRGALR